MKANRFIPAVAMLALAAACSDTATSPTSVDRPLFSLSAGTFGNVAEVNAAGTPSGGHLQSGGPVNCVVDASLNITCNGNNLSYQINGVGNTNANATLEATYSAQVDCTNRGGNLVEVKSQVTSPTVTTPRLNSRNGGLTVPALTRLAPTANDYKAAATCPNGNWTKTLAPGTPTLESFDYKLLFSGFSTPSVEIAAP
jgi:hypothetical protein